MAIHLQWGSRNGYKGWLEQAPCILLYGFCFLVLDKIHIEKIAYLLWVSGNESNGYHQTWLSTYTSFYSVISGTRYIAFYQELLALRYNFGKWYLNSVLAFGLFLQPHFVNIHRILSYRWRVSYGDKRGIFPEQATCFVFWQSVFEHLYELVEDKTHNAFFLQPMGVYGNVDKYLVPCIPDVTILTVSS